MMTGVATLGRGGASTDRGREPLMRSMTLVGSRQPPAGLVEVRPFSRVDLGAAVVACRLSSRPPYSSLAGPGALGAAVGLDTASRTASRFGSCQPFSDPRRPVRVVGFPNKCGGS